MKKWPVTMAMNVPSIFILLFKMLDCRMDLTKLHWKTVNIIIDYSFWGQETFKNSNQFMINQKKRKKKWIQTKRDGGKKPRRTQTQTQTNNAGPFLLAKLFQLDENVNFIIGIFEIILYWF